jgi:hypothetical protein
VISRRRFLLVLGGAATGVWLASTGLVQLESRFVLAVAGACSFCRKGHAEVQSLLGSVGRPHKICDECVTLCCDILSEEGCPRPPGRLASDVTAAADEARIAELLRRAADVHALAAVAAALAGEAPWHAYGDFSCSFCGAERREVAKLISGPGVFICEGCVGDAAAIVGHVLRG